MKHTFKSLAVLVIALFFFSNSQAQVQKIGHVDFNSIIDSLKDTKVASMRLDSARKVYESYLKDMENELKRKQEEYASLDANTSPVILEMKKNELYTLQGNMETYGQRAQADMTQRRDELTLPIINKIKAAIAVVAKEGGYAYVFDSGENSASGMLYHHQGDDLTLAVKKKLGMR